MHINTASLSDKTGATQRQIDIWCTRGLINPVGDSNPGSGYPRRWDESSLVGPLRVLVELSATFNGGVPYSIMKKVLDDYHNGEVKFELFSLKWETHDEAG